jgi:N-acetylneuraminic acid mutarotase
MDSFITSIAKLAEMVNGRVWQKDDKNRIYVDGGNNHLYTGQWYYELHEDDYDNHGREQYVNRCMDLMEANMEAAITLLESQQNQDITDWSRFDPSKTPNGQ